MKHFVLLVLILAGISGGCSHIAGDAGLASADRSTAYTDISKNPEAFAGKKVLVGGIIADNRSSGDVMQLEVIQLELLGSGVPDESSSSAGRFLVLSGELLDPLLYRPGTLVTINGEIKGQLVRKLDGTDYRYPLVSASKIYLFRATDPSSTRSSNPYQDQVGDERHMLRQPGAIGGE